MIRKKLILQIYKRNERQETPSNKCTTKQTSFCQIFHFFHKQGNVREKLELVTKVMLCIISGHLLRCSLIFFFDLHNWNTFRMVGLQENMGQVRTFKIFLLYYKYIKQINTSKTVYIWKENMLSLHNTKVCIEIW